MVRGLPFAAGGLAFFAVAGEAVPLSVPIGKAFALLFVVSALALRLRDPGDHPALPSALVPVAALFGWAGLSLAWTADPEATRRVCLHFGREAVLLVGLALAPDRERVLKALGFGALAGAVVLSGALIGVWADHAALRGVRISVGEGEPGVQARALAAGVLLGLLVGRGRFVITAVVFAAVGVGLAGSRGAWLALCAVLLVSTLRPPRSISRSGFAAALGGVALGVLLLAARDDARPPLPGLEGDIEQLTSGRDAIWLNAAAAARDHAVLGVGAGALPAVYEGYREALEARGGPTSKPRRDAHSLYLGAAAELGLPGLALLLLGLGLGLRTAFRRRDRSAALALTFAALSGATLVTWEHVPFWLVLAWAFLSPGAATPKSEPGPSAP